MDVVIPWNPHNHKQKRRRRRKTVHEYGQYVRYGIGIAAGISVVRWIKCKIESVPVVGILTSPFLCLMPTVLLGTAVGAAVVYGIEEGDPLAAQKKVLPKMKQHITAAHREVANMASEVGRGLRDIHHQHLEAANVAARESEVAIARLASSLDAAAAEAEATLVPTAERQLKNLQRQLDRHLKNGDEGQQQGRRWRPQQELLDPANSTGSIFGGGGGSSNSSSSGSSSRQLQLQQQQRNWQQRATPSFAGGSGSSSDGGW